MTLAERNTLNVREDTEHEEALNSTLKEVADRLLEKQIASKRGASGNAGRKDLRDEDSMDVDEPAGSESARNKNRKYVRPLLLASGIESYFSEHHRRWSRRARSVTGCDDLCSVDSYRLFTANTVTLVSLNCPICVV